MKNYSKFSLFTLALISGSASAQGLMGTSRSFSTTPFCKTYQCNFIKSEEVQSSGIWSYKNKFGDNISIYRESINPSSKIFMASFFVPRADSGYHSDDNKSVAALQKALFGTAKFTLPISCYAAEKPTPFGNYKYLGKNYIIECFNMGRAMGMGGDSLSVNIR